MIKYIIKQELALAFNNKVSVLNVLFFFVMAVSLFPFAVGPDIGLLSTIGVGVIWVCALLSSLLSVGRIFDNDFADGTLEQLLLQGSIVEKIIFAKIISHWLIGGLPITLVSPLLAMMLGVSPDNILLLFVSLLIATPLITTTGVIGASLTLGLTRGGGLLWVIILPVYIPVLIFGVANSLSYSFENIMLMIALNMLMLPICVFASSAAVKVAVE